LYKRQVALGHLCRPLGNLMQTRADLGGAPTR
jgi:hypothetical protein